MNERGQFGQRGAAGVFRKAPLPRELPTLGRPALYFPGSDAKLGLYISHKSMFYVQYHRPIPHLEACLGAILTKTREA